MGEEEKGSKHCGESPYLHNISWKIITYFLKKKYKEEGGGEKENEASS